MKPAIPDNDRQKQVSGNKFVILTEVRLAFVLKNLRKVGIRLLFIGLRLSKHQVSKIPLLYTANHHSP